MTEKNQSSQMNEIDIRKILQEKANQIIEDTKREFPIPMNKELDSLFSSIISVALTTGYIWGVSSTKQVAEYLLNNVKGDDKE